MNKRLDPKLQAELEALKKMSDEDIDFSDIPKTSEQDWENAEIGKFYRPRKESVSARIDADVMQWLRSKGKGHLTRMNEVLRQAMIEDKKAG